MRYAVARSTQVALAYAILGLGYVVMLVILLDTIWAGSLMRLWQDVRDFRSSVLLLAVPMLTIFVTAALLYRYECRGRSVRLLAVALAAGLFVVSSIGAIQVFRLWQRGLLPDVAPSGMVWMRAIGALIYGWLAFEVLRLWRASNNRFERSRGAASVSQGVDR
jgi:hypothetical protein